MDQRDALRPPLVLYIILAQYNKLASIIARQPSRVVNLIGRHFITLSVHIVELS